jgi:hypothetical protein
VLAVILIFLIFRDVQLSGHSHYRYSGNSGGHVVSLPESFHSSQDGQSIGHIHNCCSSGDLRSSGSDVGDDGFPFEFPRCDREGRSVGHINNLVSSCDHVNLGHRIGDAVGYLDLFLI